MKDTPLPEAWKMRFLANGTSGTWFYTDDIAVTDAWLRAHPDDVEVIPLCRIPPRQHSHEQHIEELRAALARMLHMHHMMLETTHYRENITDARCIREMHEAPLHAKWHLNRSRFGIRIDHDLARDRIERNTQLQALNILSRYPQKKDEV